MCIRDSSYRCGIEFEKRNNISPYPVVNDEKTALKIQKAVGEICGEEVLGDCDKWFASECYSAYQNKYPGVLGFLGIRNEAYGSGAAHHNGKFDIDEAGQITGTDFHFLGHQTPVSPWGALMRVKSGMVGAATIAFVVMISGANINVVLETGVMDDLMNWGVYKLKDKGTGILVSMMMILMAYLGGFGGTDALIAVVPVGVMFSK